MCVKILGMCLIAAQLTSVGTYDAPEMGYVKELYNTRGETYTIDTRNLYEDEQTNFYVGGDLYFEDTRLSLGYNSGVDTAKFDISKTYTIGIDHRVDITDNLDVILSGSTAIGGEVRHTVCQDSRGYEFNCLNPLSPNPAREELASITPDNKQPYTLGVKFRYRF